MSDEYYKPTLKADLMHIDSYEGHNPTTDQTVLDWGKHFDMKVPKTVTPYQAIAQLIVYPGIKAGIEAIAQYTNSDPKEIRRRIVALAGVGFGSVLASTIFDGLVTAPLLEGISQGDLMALKDQFTAMRKSNNPGFNLTGDDFQNAFEKWLLSKSEGRAAVLRHVTASTSDANAVATEKAGVAQYIVKTYKGVARA